MIVRSRGDKFEKWDWLICLCALVIIMLVLGLVL